MTYLERIKQTVQESLRMGDHELATDLRLLLAVVEAAEESIDSTKPVKRLDLAGSIVALKKEAE